MRVVVSKPHSFAANLFGWLWAVASPPPTGTAMPVSSSSRPQFPALSVAELCNARTAAASASMTALSDVLRGTTSQVDRTAAELQVSSGAMSRRDLRRRHTDGIRDSEPIFVVDRLALPQNTNTARPDQSHRFVNTSRSQALIVAIQNVVDVLNQRGDRDVIAEAALHALVHLIRAIDAQQDLDAHEASSKGGTGVQLPFSPCPRLNIPAMDAVIRIMTVHLHVMRIQMAACIALEHILAPRSSPHLPCSASPRDELSLSKSTVLAIADVCDDSHEPAAFPSVTYRGKTAPFQPEEIFALQQRVSVTFAAIAQALHLSLSKPVTLFPHAYVVYDAAASALNSFLRHFYRSFENSQQFAVDVMVNFQTNAHSQSVFHTLLKAVKRETGRFMGTDTSSQSLYKNSTSHMASSESIRQYELIVKLLQAVIGMTEMNGIIMNPVNWSETLTVFPRHAYEVCGNGTSCHQSSLRCKLCVTFLRASQSLLLTRHSSHMPNIVFVDGAVVRRGSILKALFSILSRHLDVRDVICAALQCVQEFSLACELDDVGACKPGSANIVVNRASQVVSASAPESAGYCNDIESSGDGMLDLRTSEEIVRCFCRMFSLYKSDSEILILLFRCISTLCANDRMVQRAVGSCGIIEDTVCIVRDLQSKCSLMNTNIAENAVAALCDACQFNNENAEIAVSAGTWSVIFRFFQSDTTASISFAFHLALLVAEISSLPNLPFIVDLKMYNGVTDGLLRAMDSHVASSSLAAACAKGIDNMCRKVSTVCDHLVRLKPENILVTAFKQNVQHSNFVIDTLDIFSVLDSKDSAAAIALVSSDFPSVFCHCLRTHVDVSDNASLEVVMALLLFLQRSLKGRPYFKQSYLAAGLVEEIMKVVDCCVGDGQYPVECLTCALCCLRLLCFEDNEGKDKFYDCCGPSKILAVLQHFRDDTRIVSLCCSLVLHSCHLHSRNVDEFLRCKGIDFIHSALKKYANDAVVVASALQALALFCTYKVALGKTHPLLLDAIAPAVNAVGRVSESQYCCYAGCVYLRAICLENPANSAKIVTSGGRSALVRALAASMLENKLIYMAARALVEIENSGVDIAVDSRIADVSEGDDKHHSKSPLEIGSPPGGKWNVIRAVFAISSHRR